MKKILIVTYVFPPAGGITVQRALSFAKYLPECGYEVHVLTARNAASPIMDEGLVQQIPSAVRLHRTFTPELPFYARKRIWNLIAGKKSKHQTGGAAGAARFSQMKRVLAGLVRGIFSPDPQVVWVPFAIRAAVTAIQRHGIDEVLVTAPPFSAFKIGVALKQRFPHIKLISDFRDEWLRFYLNEFEFLKSDETRRKAEHLERETVETSDLVLAVTKMSLAEIRNRYPQEPSSKFLCLPNGYDPAAFAGFSARTHENGNIVVTHAGTVYRSASPLFYLNALECLPERIRSRFETRFLGRVADDELLSMHGSRGIAIRILGQVPQAEAIRWMEETDLLLLTMTNEYSLPGKLFEYLATGKPILALSPVGGEVWNFIEETRAGWCVDPNDPAAIGRVLNEIYGKWCDGTLSGADRQDSSSYQRPVLASMLARALEERFPSAICGSVSLQRGNGEKAIVGT